MEDRTTSLREYFGIVRRRKWHMGLTFLVIMVLSTLIAFGLPAKYRSMAVIAIEEQEIPDDLIRSTITSYADERIQRISQEAMKSLNLSNIIEKHGLYADDIARVPRSELIEDMREDIHMELVSADVIDRRSGRPSKATIAFTLAFDYESPTLAQKVTNELVTLYQRVNLDTRIEQAEGTAEYLKDLVKKHTAEVLDLEGRLAVLKSDNQGALPEFVTINMQILQGFQRDLTVTESQLLNLQNRAIFLEAQLLQTDPNLPSSLDANIISDPDQYIELLKNELIVTRAKYGDNHPDVRKLQRTIAQYEGQNGLSGQVSVEQIDVQLEQARAQLDTARGHYGASHPEIARLTRFVGTLEGDRSRAVESLFGGTTITPAAGVASEVNVRSGPGTDSAIVATLRKGQTATLVDGSNSGWYKIALDDGTQGFVSKSVAVTTRQSETATVSEDDMPTNPAYLQLRVNLQSTRSEQQSLVVRYKKVQEKVVEYQAKIEQAPMVEREYSAITRDLNDARMQLGGAKMKHSEASEAVRIERENMAQRFVLLEPPIAPITPHSPNRLALLTLGFVLSLFGTLAAAAIAESLDSAIRSAHEIIDISGAPPLAAIPVMANRMDAGRSRRGLYMIAGAVVGAGLLAALLVHFLYRPLDVLWYAMLRQIGF